MAVRPALAVTVFVLALVCTDLVSAVGAGVQLSSKDVYHLNEKEKEIAIMQFTGDPTTLPPYDSRPQNRGFFVQQKPFWGYAIADLIGVDTVIQTVTAIIQHLSMIQSQFAEQEQYLCCEPSEKDANSTRFAFTYLSWPNGVDPGGHRNRAATISAMLNRCGELFSLMEREIPMDEFNTTDINGTSDYDLAKIMARKEHEWNKMIEHTLALVVSVITFVLTLNYLPTIIKFMCFFLVTAFQLYILLKSLPELLMGYVLLVLTIFSFNEGAWCAVIGVCACYSSVGVPTIWRGSKGGDEVVSQTVKYQDEAYHACSEEVKHFTRPAGGKSQSGYKCPAMSSWLSCTYKSSDYVRETASQCRQRRFLYDYCATSQQTFPNQDYWHYISGSILVFIFYYGTMSTYTFLAMRVSETYGDNGNPLRRLISYGVVREIPTPTPTPTPVL